MTTTSAKTKKEVEEETRIDGELPKDSSSNTAEATELRLEVLESRNKGSFATVSSAPATD